MIVIDGRESAQSLSNYANLEEALMRIIEAESLDTRIVTDVLINNESFSELYPHQAEDILMDEVSRLELRTVSMEDMAKDVVDELPKVVKLMSVGGREIAGLFRRSEISDALELLQDMVSVGSDFVNTLQVLRNRFSGEETGDLARMGETLGTLLGEINDAMQDEDWMLVADLLEFEFLPVTQGWAAIINNTNNDIRSFQEQ